MTYVDAFGNVCDIPADQLQRQQEGADHLRVFQQNAARDADDFERFCEVIAEHFGITLAQVKATWGIAREAYDLLKAEAAQRQSEAARAK